MTANDRKNLAARLADLAKRLPTLDPPNTKEHEFVRLGLMLLHVGVACVNDGDLAARHAAEFSARGYPAGGSDPGKTSTGDSSTERAALKGPQPWEVDVIQFAHERRILGDNAFSLWHRIARLIAEETSERRRSTLIDCANPFCDVSMTGLGEDRPREGRCERCYRFRKRTGRDWTARAEEKV